MYTVFRAAVPGVWERSAIMKFSYFHLMPYDDVQDPGPDWPVPNRLFDPQVGVRKYKEYIDTLVYAEEVGFDWIGVNEHHMSPYGLMANPNLVATAVGQRTSKAMILIAGNLIPLLNPLRVAEEYAMIDVMTNGRLVGGILRGIPHEYVAYNVPPDESYSRLDEALAFIKKAWTATEPFGWEGNHYQFRAVSIWPRPVQQPMPKIMMSGSNDESAKAAARGRAILGINTIASVDHVKHLIKVYRDEAKDAGWEPQREDIFVGSICAVAETDREAIDELEKGRAFFATTLSGGMRTAQRIVMQKSRYNKGNVAFRDIKEIFKASVEDGIRDNTLFCGSPASVAEQCERLMKAIGMGVFNVNMKVGNIPDPAIRRSMKLFGEKVIPQLRHL